MSGGVYDFGKNARKFKGVLKEKDNILYLLEGRNNGYLGDYLVYEYVLNFLMTETAIIKKYQWDSELKLGEHEDFFF